MEQSVEKYLHFQPTTTINALNEDCLIHIFEYLPIADRVRLERVCRKWNAASLKSWQYIKNFVFTKERWGSFSAKCIETPALESVLKRCGRFVTRFDTSRNNGVLPECFDHFLFRCKLDVSVLKFCPNVKGVDISNLTNDSFNKKKVSLLIRHCNQEIEELSVGSALHDACISNTICKFFHNLRVLKIIGSSSLTGSFIESLSGSLIEEFHFSSRKRDILVVCQAVKKLPNLHTLSLRGGAAITSNLPYPLDLPELKSLDLAHSCCMLADEFFINIASGCKNLIKIDLSAISFASSSAFTAIASLPKLEHLCIDGGGGSTPNIDEALTKMPNLKTFRCRDMYSITDAGIIGLLNISENLEVLDVAHCRNLSNKIVIVAINMCKLRTNGIPLRIIITGSGIKEVKIPENLNLSLYSGVLLS